MAIKAAINGTGRIGMIVAKIITARDDIELVAINTTASPEMLEYLFKYDSVHEGVDAKVIDDETIMINGKKVKMFSTRDLDELDFGSAAFNGDARWLEIGCLGHEGHPAALVRSRHACLRW